MTAPERPLFTMPRATPFAASVPRRIASQSCRAPLPLSESSFRSWHRLYRVMLPESFGFESASRVCRPVVRRELSLSVHLGLEVSVLCSSAVLQKVDCAAGRALAGMGATLMAQHVDSIHAAITNLKNAVSAANRGVNLAEGVKPTDRAIPN